MKPTYEGFEARQNAGFIEMPPPGAYIGEIFAVRVVNQGNGDNERPVIELMIEITEGEYKGRYHQVYEDQKKRFGEDNTSYRGIFRLTPYKEGDSVWRKAAFEGNLWCVAQDNPGYAWDWDETKLKGKKVGFSVQRRLYTYNGKDKEALQIARFETIADIKAGKVNPMPDKDQREKHEETPAASGGYTDVTKDTSVPW